MQPLWTKQPTSSLPVARLPTPDRRPRMDRGQVSKPWPGLSQPAADEGGDIDVLPRGVPR